MGQWESAAGTVALNCVDNTDTAIHQLTGLIPLGLYSVFVVHLNVRGPGRFTPFGDAEGTTNNFTAGLDGTATPTTSVQGCLSDRDAIVVIWHSDNQSHSASAGTVGIDWHNALITRANRWCPGLPALSGTEPTRLGGGRPKRHCADVGQCGFDRRPGVRTDV